MDLNGATIYSDEFGRLQPDPNRFPSSVGEQGFKALAAYAHSKGLLFGIHTMRGVSQAAVTQRLRVLGTNYTADEVYDRNTPCPWQPGGSPQQRFYSLNMTHPGGQAFYNALYRQYADWGVGPHARRLSPSRRMHSRSRRSLTASVLCCAAVRQTSLRTTACTPTTCPSRSQPWPPPSTPAGVRCCTRSVPARTTTRGPRR